MISPEELRRYPLFSSFNQEQRKKVSMMAEEVSLEQGAVVFEDGQPAKDLYLLVEGAIELYYVVVDNQDGNNRREFDVGEIGVGEPFGVSSVIEPPVLSATAKVKKAGRALKINARKLRKLCDADPAIGLAMMRQIAKAMMKRLEITRIHLAAARN